MCQFCIASVIDFHAGDVQAVCGLVAIPNGRTAMTRQDIWMAMQFLVLVLASHLALADEAVVDRVTRPPVSERRQVEHVQAYYNRLRRMPDSRLWGQSDYWATPAELLRAGAGDCEDIASAKYFALRELGVPAERLRLVYARVYDKSRMRIESHMVLWYREVAEADWLILDNLRDPLEKLLQRADLLPLLAFNEDQVARWYMPGNERLIGEAALLRSWDALLARQRATDQVALVISIHTL